MRGMQSYVVRNHKSINRVLPSYVVTFLMILAALPITSSLSGCGSTVVNTLGAGGVIASPSVFSFGTVPAGQAATTKISVSNPNSASINITQLSIVGQPFALVGTNNLPIPIPAKGSYDLNVAFNPTGVGAATGELTIVTDLPNNPQITIPLSGSGMGAGVLSTLGALTSSQERQGEQ